jgi:hypothetical protein
MYKASVRLFTLTGEMISFQYINTANQLLLDKERLANNKMVHLSDLSQDRDCFVKPDNFCFIDYMILGKYDGPLKELMVYDPK